MAFEIKQFSRIRANVATQNPKGEAIEFLHMAYGGCFLGISKGVPYPYVNYFAENAFGKGSNLAANVASDVKAKNVSVKRKAILPRKIKINPRLKKLAFEILMKIATKPITRRRRGEEKRRIVILMMKTK